MVSVLSFHLFVHPDLMTQKAFDQLGHRFEVCRNYFKLHACCRYNHAALDALWLMMDSHPELAQTEHIKKSVHVHSYNLAAELSDRTPRNVLACKFSLPLYPYNYTLSQIIGGAEFHRTGTHQQHHSGIMRKSYRS